MMPCLAEAALIISMRLAGRIFLMPMPSPLTLTICNVKAKGQVVIGRAGKGPRGPAACTGLLSQESLGGRGAHSCLQPQLRC